MISIRRHLTLWLLCAMALGSVLLALATYALTLEEMNEVFDEQLKQVALSALTHYDERNVPVPARPQATFDLQEFAFVTQVWTLDGTRLFVSQPGVDLPFASDEGFQTLQLRKGLWRVYTDRSMNHLVQAAQSLEVRSALAAEVAVKILIPCLLAVPLLAALLAYALRRGLRPLTQASEAVGRRGAASLAPIALGSLPIEIQPLVLSINGLMARLSDALAAQRQFTAEAAHELRTPLTALGLQIQLFTLAQDDATRADLAVDIRQGLLRATHLVEQLLNLSRAEPAAGPGTPVPVDLAALVKQVVADFAPQAESRGIDLGADIEPCAGAGADPHPHLAPPAASGTRWTVAGDAGQLRVMLNNLIDNALRYTPAQGKVDVLLRASAGEVCVEVADSGPGLAPEERGRVFDRFHRASTSLGPDGVIPGTGLGLAIVKAVAERHLARVELADGLASAAGSSGLRVRVRFALAGVETAPASTAAQPHKDATALA